MPGTLRVRRPSAPPPIMGFGAVGTGDAQRAIDDGIKEFVPAFKFGFVGLAWVMGDLAAHQIFHWTAGHATPPGYYGAKLLWSMPLLIAGRVVSDLVGGPPFVRALTIGAVATGLMQTQYFWTADFRFNITVFLIHLAFLAPLSLLIVGEPGKELLPFMRPGAKGATRGY